MAQHLPHESSSCCLLLLSTFTSCSSCNSLESTSTGSTSSPPQAHIKLLLTSLRHGPASSRSIIDPTIDYSAMPPLSLCPVEYPRVHKLFHSTVPKLQVRACQQLSQAAHNWSLCGAFPAATPLSNASYLPYFPNGASLLRLARVLLLGGQLTWSFWL